MDTQSVSSHLIHSLQYGVAGIPEYASAPAQPNPVEDRVMVAELDGLERGFIISDRPLYNADPFPQVD
jgi:hypothetical protein